MLWFLLRASIDCACLVYGSAAALSKWALFGIWINLNGMCTEGICKIRLRNNCDQYSCAYSGSVCTVGLEEAPVSSLFSADQFPQSTANVGI